MTSLETLVQGDGEFVGKPSLEGFPQTTNLRLTPFTQEREGA